jgi:hypothetical protein
MSKDILDDDFDWEDIYGDLEEGKESGKRQPVVVLRTFNTEEQAQLAAAALRAEGVSVHVLAATTGQLTPFAYGNVRLLVAQSQKELAENVLAEMNSMKQEMSAEPQISATQIVIVLVVGIFAMGLIIRVVQVLFGFLK